MTQPSLPLAGAVAPDYRDQVARLVASLHRRGWRRREVIAAELGWSIRYVRSVTEHADGAVLSGNQGLALVWEVPVAEAERSARRLIRQGEKMIARGQATRRRMHERPAASSAA